MSNGEQINYLIKPGGSLQGQIRVPGDKSISHRALMLGAIADGRTHVDGFLHGEDTLATSAAFKSMGVDIESLTNDQLIINGVGLHGLSAPESSVNLGNSGTSVRLLCGLLAGQAFDSELIGDESLMQRPMQRIIEPLKEMRAEVICGADGTLPIKIQGGQSLTGIHYTLPVPSAQLKSCLLLAGLYAEGETCIHEPVTTRDHTERMFQQFGYEIKKNNNTLCIKGGSNLTATTIKIPGDISSAAFFIVGTIIAEGSDITLQQVGVNPTRRAVIDILQMMGADIEINNQQDLSGEPIADIRIRTSQLHGIKIPKALVSIAIDEFPAIMIAAACAEGKTILNGAAELRVKESDRIMSIAKGLQSIGIETEIFADGMNVTGGKIQGGTIDSFGDHRIAMAFSMAGLVAHREITINNCINVNTSFPGFVELSKRAGLDIQERVGGE
jgi:3-phosphoshikimate 1-carboxyvinyltransferase